MKAKNITRKLFSGNLMTVRIGIALFFLLSLNACLKKIDGVDELNTNLYDYEYNGECWFYIDDA
ncbi:MAG: hypothetical protein IPM77_11515 [Crocinitomicaceae bacterium]|nr:hypothetical protein [Crocinitomicaceae bacterium]